MNDNLIWAWGYFLMASDILYGNNVGKFGLFLALVLMISGSIFMAFYIRDNLKSKKEKGK